MRQCLDMRRCSVLAGDMRKSLMGEDFDVEGQFRLVIERDKDTRCVGALPECCIGSQASRISAGYSETQP